MKTIVERLLDDWKLVGIAVTLGGIVWQGAATVSEIRAQLSELREIRIAVKSMDKTLDSLRMETLILRMKDEGKMFEYNILKTGGIQP